MCHTGIDYPSILPHVRGVSTGVQEHSLSARHCTIHIGSNTVKYRRKRQGHNEFGKVRYSGNITGF